MRTIEFATSFRRTARVIRLLLLAPHPADSAEGDFGRRLFAEKKEHPCEWSRVRMRVLRRDRYRCLGCNAPGDEVTLHVDPIQPAACDVEAMVTLCARCHNLAADLMLSGASNSEFLWSLKQYVPDAEHSPYIALRSQNV